MREGQRLERTTGVLSLSFTSILARCSLLNGGVGFRGLFSPRVFRRMTKRGGFADLYDSALRGPNDLGFRAWHLAIQGLGFRAWDIAFKV